MSSIRLSICIPTLNRAKYIGETLENIAPQLGKDAEIVIVDGGTDATEDIVARLASRYPNIRYFKSEIDQAAPSNGGFDRDCDRAVQLARGEYCWLMTDDDLFAPGAISRVMDALQAGYGLIIANAEVRNNDLTRVLVSKRLQVAHDKIYENEWDEFVRDVTDYLTFVGAVIIKRELWIRRDREKYYGSGFVHVGVILQAPVQDRLLIISDPLVSIRYGNALWSARAFQIWMFDWPQLIWSFASITEGTKHKVCPKKEPWRDPNSLVMMRAQGRYSMQEYMAFLKSRPRASLARAVAFIIALIPKNVLYRLVLFRAKQRNSQLLVHDLTNSQS